MVCMPLCLYRPFIHCIEGLFNCDAFYPSSKIRSASKHASKQFIFPSFCHIVDRNFTHMHIVYPIKLIFVQNGACNILLSGSTHTIFAIMVHLKYHMALLTKQIWPNLKPVGGRSNRLLWLEPTKSVIRFTNVCAEWANAVQYINGWAAVIGSGSGNQRQYWPYSQRRAPDIILIIVLINR